ncbi:post-transcriptional regulator [Alicyclobacillus cycloheptanicus]|jgi:hypothetical protein|nr:post-transcriptional regulator [Alicyclobacillus cycloheptanicus]
MEQEMNREGTFAGNAGADTEAAAGTPAPAAGAGELEDGHSAPAAEVQSAPRWQDYEADILELCQAKAEEFHLLGYEEVTAAQVWDCVLALTKGKGALHEMVAAVLGLQAGKFMNHLTMNAFKGVFDDSPFDAGKRA